MHIFLGFRHGKLETVIYSVYAEIQNATDMNRYIKDPQEAEKQITEWKKEHQ